MSGSDSYLWIGGTTGTWQNASNWTDINTGSVAATAPGIANDVTISASVTISGTGSAASLTFLGDATVAGDLNAGTLTASGSLTIDALGTLDAGNGTVVGNITVDGLLTGDDLSLGHFAPTETIAIWVPTGPDRGYNINTYNYGPATTLTGTGTIEAQPGGTIDLQSNAPGPSTSFQLDGNAVLEVNEGFPGNTIAGGDTIVMQGVNNTLATVYDQLSEEPGPAYPDVNAAISGFNGSDVLSSTGLYSVSTLAYMDGTLVLDTDNLDRGTAAVSFDFTGLENDTSFAAVGSDVYQVQTGSPSAGTPSQDVYTWNSAIRVGSWGDAANWDDTTQGQTPAIAAPGSLDIVSIADATVTGPGSAAAITFAGTDTLIENVTAGTVSLESTADLNVAGGATLIAGGLDLGAEGSDRPVVNMDTVSAIEVGTNGSAAAGAVTVDPGATVSGSGALLPNVVDNGLIVSTGDVFEGIVSGSGIVEVLNGGSVDILNTITGTGLVFQLDGSATLLTAASLAVGATLVMDGSSDTLVLNSTVIGTGTSKPVGSPVIAGFGTSDALVLVSPVETITSALYNAGTLDLLQGTAVVDTIPMAGNYTNSVFNVAGTTIAQQFEDIVTLSSQNAVSCFAAGTRIATRNGPVPVERLHRGDTVLTASGQQKQIEWVGHRFVDCRRHPARHTVWPVRIRRGAFAQGIPSRDLYLSPDHAVFLDQVLIPIKYLINGETILQIACETVEYYHIELPVHDVVLAEGLAVETYLDTGNRSNFANRGSIMSLYPDFGIQTFEAWDAFGCAPLFITGQPVEAARRILERRASERSAA
jgi:hypothetical protein